MVFDQYADQRTRGHEGFGLFNGKHLVKAAQESRILNWLAKEKNESDMLLFHHRFPTSTINVRKAAHPFTTKDYFGDTEYVLIHNGVISNPKKLKEAHEALGIQYQSVLQDGTFNDSEALAWDFALTMEGKQEKLQAYGGIAFIALKLVRGVPTHLYFGRNSRPLNMLRDKDGLILASEGPGEAIPSDQLHTFNLSLKRLTTKFFKVPSYDPNYVGTMWDNQRWNYGSSYQPDAGHRSGYTGQQALIPRDDWQDDDIDSFGWTDEYGLFHYWEGDEEFQDYPMPHERKSGVGGKIGDFLRQKYGDRLEAKEDADRLGIKDMDFDIERSLWVPKGEARRTELTEEETEDLLYECAEEPNQTDIEHCALAYMSTCNGCFENALWAIQDDMDLLMEQPLTQDRVNEQLKLEMTMAYIEDDAEYISGESISSMFEVPHYA